MIQVDSQRKERTYVNLTDPTGKSKSEHETVHGLTPSEVRRIIRDALVAEMRRRATQPQRAV